MQIVVKTKRQMKLSKQTVFLVLQKTLITRFFQKNWKALEHNRRGTMSSVPN